MSDRTENTLDPAGMLLFPKREHFLDRLTLQIRLRTTKIAGNYRELPSSSAHFTSKLYYPCIVSFNKNDPGEIARLIADLREEHRDLDAAIIRLSDDPGVDQLQLRRMKKRKLKLKDWIAYLESQLIPDLDA